MQPVLQTHDAYPDGSCRICKGPVSPTTMLCSRCGAAHGEVNRCPHCRTIARTVPHRELLHRCSVCGKPRLPSGLVHAQLAAPVRAELQRAHHAHKTTQILSILFFVLSAAGLFTLVTMLLFLWVAEPGPIGVGIGILLATLPLFLALYSRKARRGAEAARRQSLLFAYSEQLVASLATFEAPVDAKRIAEWCALGAPETTEELLAKLNLDERISSNITDDGELEYVVIDPAHRLPAAETRWRVPAESSTSGAPSVIEAQLDDDAPSPLEPAATSAKTTPRP